MNTILGIVLIIYFTLKIVKTFKAINILDTNVKSNLEELTLHIVNKKGNTLNAIYNKDTESFDITIDK
jgi:hypothetical protein